MEFSLIMLNLFGNFQIRHFLIDGLVDMDSLSGYLNSWISYRSIFLWSVYARKPQNLETLKDAIIIEMQSLPVELCKRASQSVPGTRFEKNFALYIFYEVSFLRVVFLFYCINKIFLIIVYLYTFRRITTSRCCLYITSVTYIV